MSEEEPELPQEVIDAIESLARGNTATKEELAEVLKFGDNDE